MEVAAEARRSVVAVSAGAGRGAGWSALANGTIVTSQRAVGYHADASIVTDDAKTEEARVVWADVERDVAFLLPRYNLGLRPFRLGETGSVRLGDELVIVSRHANDGLIVCPAVVCSADRVIGRVHVLELDTIRTACVGSPVFDRRSRVVAMIAHAAARCDAVLALPVDAFAADLAAFDRPPLQLADRPPSYRCPACAEPFTPDADRCLRCGVVLPHVARAEGQASGIAERLVKEMLATLGIVANKVRLAPGVWRIRHGGSQVDVRTDETGEHVSLRVPIVRVPSSNPEPLYRLLLTLNDQTVQTGRLAASAETIYLTLVEPARLLVERDVTALLQDLVLEAAHYRGILTGPFEAEPIVAS
jgi:hypothetical protein